MRRRTLLQSLLSAPVVWPLAGQVLAETEDISGLRVVVVGAGAFGGWTALALQQRGARVTLLEAHAAGHPRASSGGETRVIRHMYRDAREVRMAARSLALWKQAEQEWGERLLHASGVLFMRQPEGRAFFAAADAAMAAAGVDYQTLDPAELAARWPQIRLAGIEQAAFEPQSGYLLARRGCHAVVEAFRRAGGDYRIAAVSPEPVRDGRMAAVALNDGSRIPADRIVFACGPWLPALFPELLADHLKTSRQEVFYFGTPPGDRLHNESALPVWADFGPTLWYGIPGSERRGFKLADDSHGPEIDPERADRIASKAGIEAARAYVAQRFRALADAPLIDARVCQYTNTPDGAFILDRHPEAANVWLLGGGSGHGFKHGPALGELAAASVIADQVMEPGFALARLGI
ncbi:MAG: FAD-dependent oxidoreductase [Wenzhouxiangellaceae bacterium]|nr:FAD-dependent oxidoreductase [Wenzhouxiangellaceae bacterium]